MTTIKELTRFIENKFPPQLQENYDNSGLITGNPDTEISKVLLTIDVTEEVVNEAIEKKCNLIIAHHPIIFHPIKRLTGANHIERTLLKAIKNDIAIYAAHTNVDNSFDGLNKIIADKLNLKNLQIIENKQDLLYKLVVFVPVDYAEKVRTAIFEAGAGHIGNYDSCSYNITGEGTYRALDGANPFIGEIDELHHEPEIRIETVFPAFLKNKIIARMLEAHPYEEVAYDVYQLKNEKTGFGAGLIGELAEPADETEILRKIKTELNLKCLKHSALLGRKVQKIAVCTGACSFLINKVISVGADIFISSEFRYDQYISAQGKIILADAGHFETEIFIKNLFYSILTKNFTTFAVEFAEKFENPVKYL